VGDLGDVLVLLDGAVLADRGLPRRCGQLLDRLLVGFGDRPAGVNRTVRRRDDSHSRWLISSWLAPAPSTRTSSRDRKREGICRIAAVRTARWSVKVFDPALPGRSSIASDSAILASQAPSGRKP